MLVRMQNVSSSIDQTIGGTPLVRVNHLTDPDAKVLAKVEYFNPGGSIKDRVARKIIEAAEASGELKPGGTIIEATSGNTGIALAMVGAAKGYNVVIAMPASMSKERRALIAAYGAELVLTDPAEGMQGSVDKAEEIAAEREGAVLAHQFENPANAEAHFTTTGPEVWEQTGGDVDIVVAGLGTGGTITGIGKFLKDLKPEVQMVAVEPGASPLLSEGKAGPHPIQGIGANFVPDVLDQSVIDEIFTVEGDEAMEASRAAAAEEGLLVGISSGAALAAAKQIADREENRGKTIVVILPDGGERYLSTPLWETT